jgi:cyclase
VGDPINIVRLFNDKEADELIILDIEATVNKRPPQFDYLANLSGECFMPLTYGGGITSVDDIRRLLSIGIEKVSINTAAVDDPDLISKAADSFGSQAIVASIDVKKDWRGRQLAYTKAATNKTRWTPEVLAAELERKGAGEILLTSVDRDGEMAGYDLDLIKRVSSAVGIPVIACGGAGNQQHLADAVRAGASAAAAGSLFVFVGPHRAVLVNYPTTAELRKIFKTA